MKTGSKLYGWRYRLMVACAATWVAGCEFSVNEGGGGGEGGGASGTGGLGEGGEGQGAESGGGSPQGGDPGSGGTLEGGQGEGGAIGVGGEGTAGEPEGGVGGGVECDCPAEDAPVCGEDGQSYANRCFAGCAEVAVAAAGRCDEGCLCPDLWAPVCGEDGNTYPNDCAAGCAGVAPAHEGECGVEPCACPELWAPVCGEDGNTYPNDCTADCAGVAAAHEGECPVEPCVCPDMWAPVCGVDGVTYPNACSAECVAVEVIAAGECAGGDCPGEDEVRYVSRDIAECAAIDFRCPEGAEYYFDQACGCGCRIAPEPCVCPRIYMPVCGEDGVTYGNECLAACVDAPIAYEGECEAGPECLCPPVWMPVCGADGETYGSPCDADCARVEVVAEGECGAEPCVCPEVWAPVCGADGVTYPNECFAGCARVRVVEFGECRPACPSDDEVRYLSRDPRECMAIDFQCGEGAEPYFDEACGCGCRVPPEPCVCPDIFAPVCGADGITYPNACEAECARVPVIAEGECRDLACRADADCGRGQICVEGRCIIEGCICPAIFAPVCGADGRTYGNGCEAACAQTPVLHEGPCPEACEPVLCDLFCEGGFARDPNTGCEICACARPADCRDPNQVQYIGQSPEECQRIRFFCEAGTQPFFDSCGCGCEPAAPACPPVDDPAVHYVSQDPNECARIRFVCEPNQQPFSNECGCGCIAPAPLCGQGLIATPDGRCERLCYGDDTCPAGLMCNVGEVCLNDPTCPQCDVCAGWCVDAVIR